MILFIRIYDDGSKTRMKEEKRGCWGTKKLIQWLLKLQRWRHGVLFSFVPFGLMLEDKMFEELLFVVLIDVVLFSFVLWIL